MGYQITHVHMSPGGNAHEHIEKVLWREQRTGNTGESTVPQVVKYIDEDDIKFFVSDGYRRAEVGTVHPQGRRPYIRTYADGAWTNNLLSLPRY